MIIVKLSVILLWTWLHCSEFHMWRLEARGEAAILDPFPSCAACFTDATDRSFRYWSSVPHWDSIVPACIFQMISKKEEIRQTFKPLRPAQISYKFCGRIIVLHVFTWMTEFVFMSWDRGKESSHSQLSCVSFSNKTKMFMMYNSWQKADKQIKRIISISLYQIYLPLFHDHQLNVYTEIHVRYKKCEILSPAVR